FRFKNFSVTRYTNPFAYASKTANFNFLKLNEIGVYTFERTQCKSVVIFSFFTSNRFYKLETVTNRY
ncbi:MAG TPA: hypothetical protein PK930_26355, partial [Leptospiraceae bacterium]|nr:hypothetical protein [Leptospiraceae bacterium]